MMKKVFLFILTLVFIVSEYSSLLAFATPLPPSELEQLINSTDWVASAGGGSCSDNPSIIPATIGSASGGLNLNQVKTFASEPVTSTWNISNRTVEQWFLKQASAQPVITRYGLNSSNIGQITSAVQAANVSPVFFYLYTVNEGGAGSINDGFINHTNRSGLDGVAAATADAQYIASQSKIMDSQPSWIDAGNPVDFVPQTVKDAGDADFKNMPSGTIGRIYIPATAAATWEVYYPNGLKAAYNKVQDYSGPLGDAIQNIKTMGGDPQQGGASISTAGCTTSGVSGQGIAKAVSWAVMIANNNGYGYDQPTRESGWVKWQSDPSCTTSCGSFDCSSFVSAALTEAGYFKTNPNFATPSEATYLANAGFKDVTSSVSLDTGANMQPGDILLNTQDHTAIYAGNNRLVQASINENNQASGGQVGDQTGNEISVRSYYNFPWNSVWRASN